MSDFILLKWRAQQALNTSLSVGGVGACMHGCMSGGPMYNTCILDCTLAFTT